MAADERRLFLEAGVGVMVDVEGVTVAVIIEFTTSPSSSLVGETWRSTPHVVMVVVAID